MIKYIYGLYHLQKNVIRGKINNNNEETNNEEKNST